MTNTDMADEAHDETDAELEARARRQGWRPESEWSDGGGRRTRPTRFLSAAEYIEKVETETPVLRERLRFSDETNARLEKKLTEAAGEIGEMKTRLGETSDLVKNLHEQNKATGQRAYEKALRELKQEQRAAVAEADPDRFDALQRRLDELEAERAERDKPVERTPVREAAEVPAERPPQRTPQVAQETVDWVAANPWFNRDQILHDFAVEQEGEVTRGNPGWPLSDILDEVRQRTLDKFPERFGINPRRRASSPVSEPGPGRSERRGTRGRSFEDLPDDAKETFRVLQQTFKDRGIDYKREEYVADYQWE